MEIVKKFKKIIKNTTPTTIIKINLIFALIERFLVQVIGMPSAIIYVIDLLNLWLIVWLWKDREKCKQYFGLLKIYLGIILVLVITGCVYYGEWGGNVASTAIEIRNIVRFPIFFLACVIFLNNKEVKKIYKVLVIFFAINAVAILYQYFTFHPPGVWMRGDMLNGLFGTETGGNTFVNVILLVVITYMLVCWSKRKVSTLVFFGSVCISLLISALIELKAFFIEVIVIYGWYLIRKKKSRKEKYLNIFLIAAAIIVSAVGLQIMYREYPWFRETMSLSGMIGQLTGSGYTGNGDLNRFTGIFTIASEIFDGNPLKILFGIGAGNCSQSAVLGSSTLFYNQYFETHYNWFSATYLFIEGGAVVLLLYLTTFVYLFFKKKENKQYDLNSQIMCMLAVFLVFYGEALRTDAGYFVYFALAAEFIKPDKKINVKGLKKMADDIQVSVVCLAYNHEKYIRESLDSILNQDTSFKYEVIVHDDASTDHTAEIIREYEKKYPDKIVAIYQKENLYSKGVAIIEEQMLDKAKGKYIAFCECDDKWTDSRKLEMQYDYMEAHPECSMCTHNTIIHDLNHLQGDKLFNQWEEQHILTEVEAFMGWCVHTSAFFVRKENAYRPKEFRKYWFGDYVRVTTAYTEGKVVSLPYVMSQYNYGVKTGALYSADHDDLRARKDSVLSRKEYLEKLNAWSMGRFQQIINRRILLTELEADSLHERDILNYSNDKKEIVSAVKQIVEKVSYKNYISSLNGIGKMKEWIRYNGYILYPLWVKIWRK